jgi:hypothetical protein
MARRFLTEAERIARGLPDAETARRTLAAAEQQGVPAPIEDDEGFTARDWARLALEVGLGVGAVGATVATGGTAGPLVAGTVGRAALTRGIAAFGGEAAGSLLAETFDPSQEPIQRAKKTGITGAVGESIVGPAASRLFGGGRKELLEEGAEEFVEEALDVGLIPSIGRATKNRFLDIIEAIGESSFIGGGRLAKQVEKVDEFFQGSIRTFVDTFRSGASKEATEDLVSEAIEGSGDAFSKAGSSLYKVMDDAIASSSQVRTAAGRIAFKSGVDLSPLLKRIEEAKGRGLDPSAVNRISRLINNRVRDFGVDNVIPFKLAHEIRSEFLGIGRQSQALIAAKAPALGKEFSGIVDDAMEAAAKKAGGEVEVMWRNADNFWRKGKEVFNSGIIKALTRREPQSVFNAIRRAEPRDIRRVRKAINDEDLWQSVKGEFLIDLLTKSENAAEELVATGLLRRLRNIGGDRLKEIMSVPEMDRLKQLGNSLRIAQGGIGEGIPGRIFIQLRQAGALGQAGGMLLGTAGRLSGTETAMILLGPAAAARVFTSPAFVKWATLGAKFKPGTKQAINAVSQMMAVAIAEGGKTLGRDQVPQPSIGPRAPLPATLSGPRLEQ